MYIPNKISRKRTPKGYTVTLRENYEGKFLIVLDRPNGKRDIFSAPDICEGNHQYNRLLRLYS